MPVLVEPEETAASWAVLIGDRPAGLRSISLFEATADGLVLGAAGDARHRRTRAFETLGLHRLSLRHSLHNTASCRVAEKVGFAVEGTLRSAARHEDGWHDMHVHRWVGVVPTFST
jgi:[ribosomal protein S5]-alanine N-acetyltransferase